VYHECETPSDQNGRNKEVFAMGRHYAEEFKHEAVALVTAAAEQAAFEHVELNKVTLIDLFIGTTEIGSINLFHQP
jgi:hypothetical protein